jgi:hypothetical protein
LTRDREGTFPRLHEFDYEVTSPESKQYNCIAYAADDTSQKWACPPIPQPGYYWPAGAQRGNGLSALRSAFETIGYEVCEGPGYEEGFDKVVLYADADGEWQHAAKQIGCNQWSSKLGDWEDIRHATLESIGGSDYGEAVCYMKRKRLLVN